MASSPEDCTDQGENYDRAKLLEISAEDAERWERKKKKKNPDQGFSGYAEAQLRQYQRLTEQIWTTMRDRERSVEKNSTPPPTVIHGTHISSKKSIERMVEKQSEKRSKYSRRRAYSDDADIDSINERNATNTLQRSNRTWNSRVTMDTVTMDNPPQSHSNKKSCTDISKKCFFEICLLCSGLVNYYYFIL